LDELRRLKLKVLCQNAKHLSPRYFSNGDPTDRNTLILIDFNPCHCHIFQDIIILPPKVCNMAIATAAVAVETGIREMKRIV